jgi:hypothetical protein
MAVLFLGVEKSRALCLHSTEGVSEAAAEEGTEKIKTNAISANATTVLIDHSFAVQQVLKGDRSFI